nr:uncharacterized protein LOC129259739 [Lytechinus pictus]
MRLFHKITIVFLLIAYSIIATDEDNHPRVSPQFLTLIEGDDAEIVFTHPFHVNTPVSLKREHRYPFYQNGKFVNGVSTMRERFKVQEGMVEGSSIIRLEILNTKREDSGTYVCEVTVPDGNLTTPGSLIQRVSLTVNYPPGNTTCRFLKDSVDLGDTTWRFIECHASRGSITGYILCFQEGITVPPRTRLAKNSSILTQQFTVRDSIPFSCCTSVFLTPKSVDTCGDFKEFQREYELRIPESNDELSVTTTASIITNPTPADNPTSSQYPPDKESSTQHPKLSEYEQIDSGVFFWVLFAMILANLITCVAILVVRNEGGPILHSFCKTRLWIQPRPRPDDATPLPFFIKPVSESSSYLNNAIGWTISDAVPCNSDISDMFVDEPNDAVVREGDNVTLTCSILTSDFDDTQIKWDISPDIYVTVIRKTINGRSNIKTSELTIYDVGRTEQHFRCISQFQRTDGSGSLHDENHVYEDPDVDQDTPDDLQITHTYFIGSESSSPSTSSSFYFREALSMDHDDEDDYLQPTSPEKRHSDSHIAQIMRSTRL